jgi:glycerol-3-phosphate acyltransferase PlsY
MEILMDFLFNQNILLYITAYFLAAVPFGFILAKVFAGVDVRKEGSGNIGATNVLRVLKDKAPKLAKKLTIATFALDAVKGAIIILLAMTLGAEPAVLWTIAVLSVLGHCFSPFLGFEGGKGVATGFGVLLVLLPIPSLVAIVVWFIAGKVLKISSLSSLIALITLLVASYIVHPEIEGIYTHTPIWIIAFIVFYKHIPNIIRVINKEEKQVV